MKEIQGLFFNLLGIIKDASTLPKTLKNNQLIHVWRQENKESASIKFVKDPEGNFFKPPSTELTEKEIDYFLIQIVNSYKGATLIVKSGEKNKSKEIRVDKNGIQRCNIRNAGLVTRVNQRGDVEIYYVSSPTIENKKQIKVLTIFEDNLPFEDSGLIDTVIENEEKLKPHGTELKEAYAKLKAKTNEKKETPTEPQKEVKKVENSLTKGLKKLETKETEEEPKKKTVKPKKKKVVKKSDGGKKKRTLKTESEKKEAEKEIKEYSK